MNIKTIAGYTGVIILSFFIHITTPTNVLIRSSLPVFMVMYPISLDHKVKIKFTVKDILIGIGMSVVLLVPYFYIVKSSIGPVSGYFIIYQILSISFPEEFFFRGFLQDSMGRNIKAVIFVSILFSIAHLPKAYFHNEWMVLASFFPSLVIGWLYMKTNNIIPGTIFHIFANIVYHYAPLRF